MNKASRIAAGINSGSNRFQLRACLFHSTPVSERRRRTSWDPANFYKDSPKEYNRYNRRQRKRAMFRDANEFAENIFQSWDSGRDKYEQPNSRKSSWFRTNFGNDGPKRGKTRNKASQRFHRRFEFCEDDDDSSRFDNIFRSIFGGNRSFYWSFTMHDEPPFSSSSSYSSNYRTYTGPKYETDEEYEEYTSSSYYAKPVDELRSDRLALGLSPSGPLNIEDVKTAYRACALKWHPDRHQDSAKVVAEAKFKACSAAYQSLCDKLAVQ